MPLQAFSRESNHCAFVLEEEQQENETRRGIEGLRCNLGELENLVRHPLGHRQGILPLLKRVGENQ